MISMVQQPRAHKSLAVSNAQRVVNHPSSRSSSTRANLRSHSLPTPAPSPAPSLSSTSASASESSAYSSPLVNMLALGNPASSFAPFARSFSPFAPAFNMPQSRLRALRQGMPATPDASCLALPVFESDELQAFRASKSRVVRLCNFPVSTDTLTRALTSLFPLFFLHPSVGGIVDEPRKPTPVRMWTLRANAANQEGERPVWAVFSSHEEACAALTVPAYESGLGDGSIDVMPVLESELEPFSKLQPYNPSLSSLVELASDRSTQSPMMSMQSHMRYPPSPTSTNVTEAETEAELFFPDARDDFDFGYRLGHGYDYAQTLGIGYGSAMGAMTPAMRARSTHAIEALHSMQACGFTLSTNPPKARSGFRHGDWMCPVPACGAHNFGRNVSCIQCAAPRPSNLTFFGGGFAQPPSCPNGLSNAVGASLMPPGARNMSPRFASTMSAQQPQAQAQQQHHHHQELLVKAQMQAQVQAQTHSLLTPSGRAFAVGGKVQNVSSDPLAPCVMFWPDNEPFPEPGQIRPASLSNIHQPPILNTGNKGPIERQPGDWSCHKCEYLNWRRRKVCQTCFPYAEGNGDSVSATMHAERLALLAAVYGQTHPLITHAQAQASLMFPGRSQARDGSFHLPVPNASTPYSSATSLPQPPNYPFPTSPSSHRSQFSSAPAPTRRPPIPSLSVSTSVTNSSRGAGRSAGGTCRSVGQANSISDRSLGAGSIVYQTPSSPATIRPPPSISTALASGYTSPQACSPTPILPSFLKHELQPLRVVPRPFPGVLATSDAGTRSPASISPASSTSTDLPFDEHDAPAKAVGIIGSGRNAGFYAHPRGAGSGSSTGSSSNLSLTGGSIWSLERDENSSWSNGLFSTAEALKGLTL